MSKPQQQSLHNYQTTSRIHPIFSQLQLPCSTFLKREDELSSGISGTKLRKYLSLLPILKDSSFQQAFLIGSRNSNNLVGLAQALSEINLPFQLFLCGPESRTGGLNFTLLQKLWPKTPIHWIPQDQWSEAHSIVQIKAKQESLNTLTIPEGAFMPEALPGAMTLADDIIRQQTEQSLFFDHIFIDSGTGMSATALLLRLKQLNYLGKVHIVQVAGNLVEFQKNLEQVIKWGESLLNIPPQEIKLEDDYFLYRPISAPSFGGTNQKIFQFLREFAQNEGVLLDPIYSVKLIMTGLEIIQSKSLKDNALFIHSGGVQSLYGFLHQL